MRARANIVIAGGGVGALESALALRALAADRVRMTLVAPDPELTFRPTAPFEAFGHAAPPRYELEAITRDLHMRLRAGRLEAVAPQTRTVRLASGSRLHFDALILATGARAVSSIPGALTFRNQRDVPALRRILRELDSGALERLAFAVPSGSSWPLPVYELALLSADWAERSSSGTEIALVSPERRPLEIFGTGASRRIEDELAARGVHFVGGSAAVACSNGTLTLQGDAPIRAERVITVPQLRVPRVTGVPGSWWGFVPTDTAGRVQGLSDVYAAGDMTTYPIKQGGLATQQADRIAHDIAGSLGVPVKAQRDSHVLRARLLGGKRTLILRVELDWQGRPAGGTVEVVRPDGEVRSPKVFGRYLTPYLQGLGARAAACAAPDRDTSRS